MEKKLKQHFEATEKLFLEYFQPYSSTFELEKKIVDVVPIQRKQFARLADKFNPCYALYLTLFNASLRKSIHLIFTDGFDLDGKHYNSITLHFEYSKNEQVTTINIGDYFKHKEIDIKLNEHFMVKSAAKALKKIEEYIKDTSMVLEDKEIKQILTTKDWIMIKKDMSAYR